MNELANRHNVLQLRRACPSLRYGVLKSLEGHFITKKSKMHHILSKTNF
jgi:hypothetical protein